MNNQRYDIIDTTYHLHTEPDDSTIIEIRYVVKVCDGERLRSFSEYISFEKEEMRKVAVCWWRDHSPDPIPEMNQDAIDIANYHGVDIQKQLEVSYNGMGYNIIGTITGEKAKKLSEIW